jgi:hypothetical protein
MDTKGRQGFASMSVEKRREIAGKGGRAVHQKGTSHEWTSEEAKVAGKKGGTASAGTGATLGYDAGRNSRVRRCPPSCELRANVAHLTRLIHLWYAPSYGRCASVGLFLMRSISHERLNPTRGAVRA